jgi:hypothetical protein
MSGTVSNHDTIIATKGTPHVAKAKPSTADHCFDVQKKPVVFGNNEINTYHLNKGKPTKTFIADHPPWTQHGWIDEIPSWPAHAGIGGGVIQNVGGKGLNYIQYAYPTSYSQDVKIEGGGVVRTDDTTKQNGGNCNGYVDGSNLKQWSDSATDLMKKKCTIKKVTGTCGHGREIGAPPNAEKGADGFYLDVLGGDTVTLKSDRKDVSVPGKETAPTCANHTYWFAHRSGIDNLVVKKDKLGDEFKIEGDLMKDPMPDLLNPFKTSAKDEASGLSYSGSLGSSGGTEDRTKRRTEAVSTARARSQAADLNEAGHRNVTIQLESSTKAEQDAKAKREAAAGPQPLDRRGLAKREEEKAGKIVKTAQTAAEIGKLLAQLWMHWQFERNPPVVNVTAIACSGAKHVKLRVFPAADVTYSLPLESMQKLLDKLHSLGSVATMIRDKLKIKTKFEFLQGFSAEFALGMKELTTDKNGRFKTEVRRAWNLGLKIEKVIYLYAEGELSLITLLGNGIFPGLGNVLEEIAALAGFTLSGFLSGEIQLSIQVSAGFDEYFEGSVAGSECALVGTIKLGVKAEYDGRAGHFKAWANTIWENTLKATNFRNPDTPECWFIFDVVGYIQLGAEAGYVADLFNWNRISRATIGISKSDSVTWKPSWLKFPKDDKIGTIKVLPVKS